MQPSAREVCPTCGVRWREHVLCSICHNTNASTRLCNYCQNDPANVDWHTSSSREELGAELDSGSDERLLTRSALQDCQSKRGRKPTEMQKVVLGLLLHGVFVQRPYRDRRGRRRGTRQRVRALRVSEVAQIAGCHENYVFRLRKLVLHANFTTQRDD